jgi:hypothetical protein
MRAIRAAGSRQSSLEHLPFERTGSSGSGGAGGASQLSGAMASASSIGASGGERAAKMAALSASDKELILQLQARASSSGRRVPRTPHGQIVPPSR